MYKDDEGKDATIFSYLMVLAPLLQFILSVVWFILLYNVYQTDLDGKGEIGMIGVTFGAIIGVITSLVGMVKHSGVFGFYDN